VVLGKLTQNGSPSNGKAAEVTHSNTTRNGILHNGNGVSHKTAQPRKASPVSQRPAPAKAKAAAR
jgi:hypothetical protein